MSTQKLITIFGATGQQGGSVAQALLRDKSGAFKLRGVTRNLESDKAKALAAAGVEMVAADGLVKDQITSAFRGSWGVFVNTNSDDAAIGQENGPSETDVGKILVDAAVDAGVKHFVYSGSVSASETTGGAFPNQAFEEKHAIGQYARSKPSFSSVVVVSPGWYMENWFSEEMSPLFGGFPHTVDQDGYVTFSCPLWGGNNEIPLISIGADYGDIVHGVFLDPVKYNGILVQGISQSRALEDVVKDFESATGKKSRFVPMKSWEDFETFGDRTLITVQRMFGFCQHNGGLYYGVPNDTALPAELKASAAEAQGRSGDDVNLARAASFFRENFS